MEKYLFLKDKESKIESAEFICKSYRGRLENKNAKLKTGFWLIDHQIHQQDREAEPEPAQRFFLCIALPLPRRSAEFQQRQPELS